VLEAMEQEIFIRDARAQARWILLIEGGITRMILGKRADALNKP